MSIYKFRYVIACFSVVFLWMSCGRINRQMQEGRWRGEFVLPGKSIPFLFDVTHTKPDSTFIFLVNGKERVQLKNITFRDDSVFIPVEMYDAMFAGKLSGKSVSGKFKRLNTEKPDAGIPFLAEAGDIPRFSPVGEPSSISLAGTWDIRIGSGEEADQTVGIFEQAGTSLSGSILTNTGDYRYLDGTTGGNKFRLSVFSGNAPYLVTGELTSDSTFTGEFVTSRSSQKMQGKRNPRAALADPYSFSKLKEGYSSIEFTFPNLENRTVSLSDPRYKGKVVIVTILGSWCPNCLDEAAFLAPWYIKNKDRGVEIIGLAFERKNDFEYARQTLTKLKNRLDIRYELLFAGPAGTQSASKALPALTGISAFPSAIFIDKRGNVRKVHSGFSGPATGKYYQEFQAEFNSLVDELLAEK